MSHASVHFTDPQIAVRATSQRARPDTSFGLMMRRGLHGSLRTAASHTGAGYMVPGAAVLSAALQQAGSIADSGGGTAAASLGAGFMTGGGADGGKMGPEELLQANREMQAQNQAFNMQMISIQEGLQAESRKYTMQSNIMKTKHEALRNTISNSR